MFTSHITALFKINDNDEGIESTLSSAIYQGIDCFQLLRLPTDLRCFTRTDFQELLSLIHGKTAVRCSDCTLDILFECPWKFPIAEIN